MEFEIKEFLPLKASDDVWNEYFNYMEIIHKELDPDDVLPSRKKRKEMFLAYLKIRYFMKRCFLLSPKNERKIIGFSSIEWETPKSPSYTTNKYVGYLRISVLPEYRRKGFGRILLKRIVDQISIDNPEVTEFFTYAFIEPGWKFVENLGGTLSLESVENRLYLKDVDWNMVRAWHDDGIKRNCETEIIRVSTIPEQDLDSFCKLYTELMNQQPLGEISLRSNFTPEMLRLREREYKNNEVDNIVIYTKEKSREISGITEISYMPDPGHKINQLLTGVRNTCRGRGLGKLLKAAMLLYIKEKYPLVKYISTGNANSNAPMLSINRRLGFKKWLPIKLYKLKISDIKF